MERALDPALLRRALGENQNLPSAEQLAATIARAEIELLAGGTSVPDDLIGLGWYLHAVAASPSAAERYGIQRQRSAFRVSAHVFDLALRATRSLPVDRVWRLKLCFAAQVAYVRSEVNPNALALYRRHAELNSNIPSLLDSPGEASLSAAIALLGVDTRMVLQYARTVAVEVGERERGWATDEWLPISETIFGAADLVIRACNQLAYFLLYGDGRRLSDAEELLERASLSRAAATDQVSRWVAIHLRSIADDLGRTSLWRALPPDTPVTVRRAFTLGEPRVLTLWPSQIDFLTPGYEGEPSPLAQVARRIVLSTPTSGGKTLFAQLLIATHLATAGSAVCYVAPTRSLCHEVRTSLQRRLRALQVSIDADLPLGSPLPSAPPGPHVEVMTPERLGHLLRVDAEGFLNNFGLFVFDEVHNVGGTGRGWTFESDITFIHWATRERNHRIVLISAVVGNKVHFINWLGDEREVVKRDLDWRGPRRLHCVWTTAPDWQRASVVATASSRAQPRTLYPLMGKLFVRTATDGALSEVTLDRSVGNLVLRKCLDGSLRRDERSTKAYEALVPLIGMLAAAGPVLVIAPTKDYALRMARAIGNAGTFTPTPGLRELVDVAEQRLGVDHPLTDALMHGVAYHHGSLPAELRVGIEEAVADGNLACLIATTTMTEGVNLPVRAVVVAQQGVQTAKGYDKYITGPRLINAIGRAGRATRETEGVVVLCASSDEIGAAFDEMEPPTAAMTVLSMLATKQALDELAEFEASGRAATDRIFEAEGIALNGFISFAWFLSAHWEETRHTLATDTDAQRAQLTAVLDDALKSTLGWRQLSEGDRHRWSAIAATVAGAYLQSEPAARRRWSVAGTRIGAARTLDRMADEVAALPAELLMAAPGALLMALLSDDRLERLLALPDAPDVVVQSARLGSGRQIVKWQPLELVLSWVAGLELRAIADRYFGSIVDVAFRAERTAEVINDVCETFLPWVLSTVIVWANERRNASLELVTIPTEVSGYVRYGVDDPTALRLMVGGVRSRRVALEAASQWNLAGTPDDVFAWLAGLGVPRWRERFGASLADLRNLLDVTRFRTGSAMQALLNHEEIVIPLEDRADVQEGPAELRSRDESDISLVEAWWGLTKVGTIPSSYQRDLLLLIRSGILLRARIVAREGGPHVALQIVESEDQRLK